MNRGTALLVLMLLVTACGVPIEAPMPDPAIETIQAPIQPVPVAPAQEATEEEIDDLVAGQAASDVLAPRPPERTDRPGRGSLTPPDWLGQRPLPLRADGFGEIQPTPFELIDRRFAPSTYLRLGSPTFESTSGSVPPDVLARSTWQEACPVSSEELAYLTVSFLGFDGNPYIGEVIVNASVADEMVGVFRVMFENGFPLEEVRVIAPDELEAAPTGDGNVTTVFVCRPVTGGASWSQHAYGLAIDINPFHNPYLKSDLVLPELASVYTDRSLDLPGMIVEGDPVVQAFDAIGWGWGGRWTTLTDPQHFSANGR
ncbi:MAG: M15 family metallopeptidase [Acidimicrobiia bacterium]|nr:M15 family metallopeptidase [Acidimicrobiia bacterium]